MEEKKNKKTYAKAITACVGLVAIATTAQLLRSPHIWFTVILLMFLIEEV